MAILIIENDFVLFDPSVSPIFALLPPRCTFWLVFDGNVIKPRFTNRFSLRKRQNLLSWALNYVQCVNRYLTLLHKPQTA